MNDRDRDLVYAAALSMIDNGTVRLHRAMRRLNIDRKKAFEASLMIHEGLLLRKELKNGKAG